MKLPFTSLWSEFKAFAFKGNMIELAVAVIIGGAFGTVVTSLTNDVIMPSIGYVIHKGEETAAAVKEKTTEVASAVASKTGLTTQPTSQPTTQPTTPAVATATPAAPSAPAVPAIPTVPDVKTSASGVTDVVAIFKELEAEKDAKDAEKAATDAKAKAEADAKAKASEPIKIDLKLGPVDIGKFIGALLNFLIVAFAVFILVVKVMDGVMKRMSKPVSAGEPTTRECPECLSIIPIKAKRCSHCTAIIEPVKA